MNDNNQCSICLESNDNKVYRFCKDCNIYTHVNCFYEYINFKDILPECIVCKKKCELKYNNTYLATIQYVLFILFNICKENPFNVIKYSLIIIYWVIYISPFVYNTLINIIYYIVDQNYDTNGYFIMIGLLYYTCNCYISYIKASIIMILYQSILYNLYGDSILKFSIIQSYYKNYLYTYLIPEILLTSIMTYPVINSVYKLYNLYKKWYLISICKIYML